MASSSTGHCTICETPGARACARCKSSHYCSKECQLDDWPVHKLLCASFSSFAMSARPSETHFRGIFFPQDRPKPQVAWLDCQWHDDEDDGIKWQHPDLNPFLGPDSWPKSIPIQTDAVLQRILPDTINICYRDGFLVDGSMPNRSAAAVVATLPGQSHDWRGPIIVVGKKGQGLDPPQCRDLDMNDFRYIADYLISYGRWSLDIRDSGMTSADKVVKGIRINCLGDRQVLGKPHFEPVDVHSTDSIFDDFWHDTSDIADRIGLPLLTRRCPVSLRWAREKRLPDFGSQSPCNNQDATFLHLCCDSKADSYPSGPGWSWAGWQWQNHVGSVIVVRRDKKPLAPMHVEALCTYCRYDVRPLMGHTMGEYEPDEPLTRDLVLKMICRPTFSICWYKLRDRKRTEGDDLSAPFPYSV
ncbi:hypothetical protein BKA56DRAFT_589904 [Ilyonectria sp. MPI-CAGE-AT-0026]|nr:hypothetical protein BKA56DRAFT_589904 [Ilyonectria sp. MPI-CAGE-AT-0026]